MIFEPTLISSTLDIDAGLASGQFTRWGGLVRVSKGFPGGGQIVGMLRDVFHPEKDLKRIQVVTNTGGHIATQSLISDGVSVLNSQMGHLLNLTGIGTAASVANLGITAVGLYIMNKKLNALQKSISSVQSLCDAGFKAIDDRFDGIQQQLVELKIFALLGQDALREAIHGIFDVKKALFSEQIAILQVAMGKLNCAEIATESYSLPYLDDISRVRLSMEGELEGRYLSIENHPDRFLDTMMLLRGWTMAGSSEVYVQRRIGDLNAGAETADHLSRKVRNWVSRWTNDLTPENEKMGVARFAHSKFNISEGEKRLLFRAQAGDDIELGEMRSLEIDGSRMVSQHLPVLDDAWFERQQGIAQTMVMIEETAERIESLNAEAQYCRKNRLGFNHWEKLV